MDDNIVDSLRIEIEGDSGKAIDSIGKLISTLEKIKNVTSGSNKGLNAIQKNLNKITESVNKIDSGSTSKLRDLAEGLKGLNEVGNIKTGKTADRIVDLGAAVDLLKDVDFTKLTELVNGLQALGGVGNVNIPRFDNTSAPTPNASPSPAFDEQVFIPPSTIEETRSALNNLSADVNRNRSLWTDLGEIGRKAFQKLDTALIPVKAKVAGVAAAGIIQFNVLKSKLSDVASTASTKLGYAFNTVKEKMQPVSNAARYVWNTITQPIQSALSKLGSVGGKFGEIFGKAKTALAPIGNIAQSAFGKLGSLAAKGAASVAKSFTKIAGKPLTSFKNAITKATAKVGELFTMFKKRTMYRAINAIISAITTGFKEGTANVYQYSKALGGTLASSLDSIATSFLYFKNSIGAAVAPLINMLAPAIDYIIDKCVDLLNALNQVFAKFSGASTWTKAVKYPTEYAEAAESATAANKKLKASILGIDEINPLTDNSSSGSGGAGSGMDYSQMFEEVELGEINNPFKDFFKPFTDAWANEGQNTINSIKNAFNGVKEFISAVGESFRKVWANGTGQQTVETILHIFQNILNCVGNLGSSLAKAWRANDNGTKILQNIWNIFNDLLGFVEGIYGATANWLASLDFTPLMTAFAGCTAALEPLVNLIGDSLAWCYETVLLPLASWVIEEAAPAALNLLSTAIETVSNVVSAFQPFGEWLWVNFLQPLGEWAGEVFIESLETINNLLSKFNEFLEGNITFGEFLDNLSLGETLLLAVAAAVGVVTAAVAIWNGIGAIATGVTAAFGTAVAVLTSPVMLVIAAIAALIAAGILLYQNWDVVKEKVTAVWNAIWKALKGVINGILGGIEGMVNGVIKGLNFMINALNKLSFDVPDWVPVIGGKKFGFNIKNISEVLLPRLADGGMVNAGTAFIAGEAGAEVVANIGKRTGVMNTDQMRESVEQGVIDANAEQNALLREEISILRKILDKDTSPSSYGGARSVISDIERKNRRDGKTVIPVGV